MALFVFFFGTISIIPFGQTQKLGRGAFIFLFFLFFLHPYRLFPSPSAPPLLYYFVTSQLLRTQRCFRDRLINMALPRLICVAGSKEAADARLKKSDNACNYINTHGNLMEIVARQINTLSGYPGSCVAPAVSRPVCQHGRRGRAAALGFCAGSCRPIPFAALRLDSDTFSTSEQRRAVCRAVIEKKNLLKAAGWEKKKQKSKYYLSSAAGMGGEKNNAY